MISRNVLNYIYIASEWIYKFFLSNLIWLLFNLPLVYVIFNIFVTDAPETLLANIILSLIIAPITLFPATTALFGITRKWVMLDKEIPLFRSYLKYYKENFWKSLFGGALLVPLWVILFIDYQYFKLMNSPLFYIFLAVLIFMIAITMNFFSYTVHNELRFFQIFKNSFLLSLGKPVYTIGIAIIVFLTLFISFRVSPMIIFLGLGPIMSYLCFLLFSKAVHLESD